jgi:hypothetical protein
MDASERKKKLWIEKASLQSSKEISKLLLEYTKLQSKEQNFPAITSTTSYS